MALCKLALLAVLSAACFAVSIQAVDLNVTQPSAAYPGFAGIYVETAETCGGKTIFYCAECTGTESDGQYLLWAPIPIRTPLPYHWGFGTKVCDEDNLDTLEGNPNLGQRFVYNAEVDGDVPLMANFADDQTSLTNSWEEMGGAIFERIQPTSEDNVPLSYFVITAVTPPDTETPTTDATAAPTDSPTTGAPTASPLGSSLACPPNLTSSPDEEAVRVREEAVRLREEAIRLREISTRTREDAIRGREDAVSLREVFCKGMNVRPLRYV